MRMKTLDSRNKIAVIASFDEIVYFNQLNINKFSLNVCKEGIFMAQVVMFLQKNSFLKQAFDQKIMTLKANGLINFWISKHMSYSYLVIEPAVRGPTRLNVDQLFGAFEVWFSCLFVSTLAFAVELMLKRGKR